MNYSVMPYQVNHKAEDFWDIEYTETRYRIIDPITGEILDDAQGYGYKTAKGAHKAWYYKTRTPEQKKKAKSNMDAVRKWCIEHRSTVRTLEEIAFEICSGKWGYDDKFDGKFVEEYCKENNIDLPVSGNTFLKYWYKV